MEWRGFHPSRRWSLALSATQVVVSPAQYESGKVIYPYENAK